MEHVEDVVNENGEAVSKHILFKHAWTGCDTTSSIYGKGKTSIVKDLKKNEIYQNLADAFEDECATQEEIGDAGLQFFIRSYKGNESSTLADLRYNGFMEVLATCTSSVKPQVLPPTERSAYYHSLRVHLQVIQWKSLLGTSLEPTNWGWELRDGYYEPIMTDMKVAPDNILKFIQCKCKTSTKSPCGTNTCTCKKNRLKCVAACGHCHGDQCNNVEDVIAENNSSDEEHSDANIFDLLENFMIFSSKKNFAQKCTSSLRHFVHLLGENTLLLYQP